MPIDVKFAYVCRFKFTDLPGDSNDVRHCNQCDLDVTNLDAMDDAAVESFMQEARESKRRFCVSATVVSPDSEQCPDMPVFPTAGAPISIRHRS
jgi:hypothetical protein